MKNPFADDLPDGASWRVWLLRYLMAVMLGTLLALTSLGTF